MERAFIPRSPAEEGWRRRDSQTQVSLTPHAPSASRRQPSRRLLFPMSSRSRQNPRTSSSSTAAGSSSPTSSRRYGAFSLTETGHMLTCVGNRASGWQRALSPEPSSLALICPRASGSTTTRRLGTKSASRTSSGRSRDHEEIELVHRDQAVSKRASRRHDGQVQKLRCSRLDTRPSHRDKTAQHTDIVGFIYLPTGRRGWVDNLNKVLGRPYTEREEGRGREPCWIRPLLPGRRCICTRDERLPAPAKLYA